MSDVDTLSRIILRSVAHAGTSGCSPEELARIGEAVDDLELRAALLRMTIDGRLVIRWPDDAVEPMYHPGLSHE